MATRGNIFAFIDANFQDTNITKQALYLWDTMSLQNLWKSHRENISYNYKTKILPLDFYQDHLKLIQH